GRKRSRCWCSRSRCRTTPTRPWHRACNARMRAPRAVSAVLSPRQARARMRSLSLPHEHGAYLTLVGGGVAAALQAPRRLAAVGFGGVPAAAFFAREPLVKRARWDDAFLVLLAVAAAVGAAMAEWPWGSVAAAGAAAIVGGFLAARRARQHRAPWFEWVRMAALGGAAGLEAAAGGGARPRAAAPCRLLPAHRGRPRPRAR